MMTVSVVYNNGAFIMILNITINMHHILYTHPVSALVCYVPSGLSRLTHSTYMIQVMMMIGVLVMMIGAMVMM